MGQLIRAALDLNDRRIVLAPGGSACTDGAAAIYGPQKGVGDVGVRLLGSALVRFASITETACRPQTATRPGTGTGPRGGPERRT
jgi:glycerate kinase